MHNDSPIRVIGHSRVRNEILMKIWWKFDEYPTHLHVNHKSTFCDIASEDDILIYESVRSRVWHDSCNISRDTYVTWFICDVTHAWRDSCVTWPIHVCDMIRMGLCIVCACVYICVCVCVCVLSCVCVRDIYQWVTVSICETTQKCRKRGRVHSYMCLSAKM